MSDIVSEQSVINVNKGNSKPLQHIESAIGDNDDAGSVFIIILQCETKPCDKNITNLKWIFSDPFFTVQVCAVDPPSDKVNIQFIENYSMRKALTYASEGPYLPNSQGKIEPQFWWNKTPVIIVKDSSVSNITSENNVIGCMKKRIKIALDRAPQADLFFLCKWNDACDKYVDVKGVQGIENGSTLKWSVRPTSTQAIMYMPKARDYVRESLVKENVMLSEFLNRNIASGQMLATVFVPNIIDFDIDLATSDNDYAKLNECATPGTSNTSTSNTAAFIWLIIIIILVVIVAWALIQIIPTYIH